MGELRWRLRELWVNNRWAARRRWKHLPEALRDRLTLATREAEESPESLQEDPRWPGVKFAPGVLEDLHYLEQLAAEEDNTQP